MWRPSLLLLPETQHQKPGGLKQHRRSILTFIVVSWPFPSIFKMHLSNFCFPSHISYSCSPCSSKDPDHLTNPGELPPHRKILHSTTSTKSLFLCKTIYLQALRIRTWTFGEDHYFAYHTDVG